MIEKNDIPLAERLRPKDFSEIYGQEELTGGSSPLKKLIEADILPSLIFWGPPGTGKTSLAYVISKKTKASFHSFSAASDKISQIQKVIESALRKGQLLKQKTIVFIDEIHRLNKAQQDKLLPYLEKGTIILIGATTENPSFELIPSLLSRTSVFIFKPLSDRALEKIIKRALSSKEALGMLKLKINEQTLKQLIGFADGDARRALNLLEFLVNSLGLKENQTITQEHLREVLQKKTLRFDKRGEQYYNLISAFIKSLRDSDPDAALYWLARMIESGQDPVFIARRMIIFASEDIGNAQPHALTLAVSCFEAVERIGLPEAAINLAQVTVFLAQAPKSNASYQAYLKALEDAKRGSFEVPLHLRNPVTKLMRDLGYGKDYKYAHDFYTKSQEFSQSHFPKEMGSRKYYFPKDIGYERKIRETTEKIRKSALKAKKSRRQAGRLPEK